jgi:hypothetical protein
MLLKEDNENHRSHMFIGSPTIQKHMVSRSLEKMMLVAVGLTTAVLVGAPVLLYAVVTMDSAAQVRQAETLADMIHNATAKVDTGSTSEITIEVVVPKYTNVTASGTTLTVTYRRENTEPIIWYETYIHNIVMVAGPSLAPNAFFVQVRLVADTIEMTFSYASPPHG